MHSVHSMITTHHQRYLYNFVNCDSYHVVILGTVSGQLETETESGNGKRKRKAEKGNGRHSNTYTVQAINARIGA